MNNADIENLARAETSKAVTLFCMASMVANEASREGFVGLAKSIEGALQGFLSDLGRDQQAQALQLAYELALQGEEPAPPRLRLIYSRD